MKWPTYDIESLGVTLASSLLCAFFMTVQMINIGVSAFIAITLIGAIPGCLAVLIRGPDPNVGEPAIPFYILNCAMCVTLALVVVAIAFGMRMVL